MFHVAIDFLPNCNSISLHYISSRVHSRATQFAWIQAVGSNRPSADNTISSRILKFLSYSSTFDVSPVWRTAESGNEFTAERDGKEETGLESMEIFIPEIFLGITALPLWSLYLYKFNSLWYFRVFFAWELPTLQKNLRNLSSAINLCIFLRFFFFVVFAILYSTVCSLSIVHFPDIRLLCKHN